MSRAYTKDEVVEELLKHFKVMAKYWANVEGRTVEEKCDGVVFSILSTLDGCSLNLPAFDLKPCPHPEDKQFHIDEEENWYDPDMVISEMLHERYSNV